MFRLICLATLVPMLTLGCDCHEFHDGDHWDDHDDHRRTDDDGGPAPGDDVDSFGCASTSDCTEAEVCVEAACVDREGTCTFDAECGAGRGCVDNACRPSCTDDEGCTAGTACVSGRCRPVVECESHDECDGSRCVDNRCLAPCSGDDDCGAEEVCGVGDVCRHDIAPRPFCADDSECAAGHVCVEGVCRTPCDDGTDRECLRWDNQFTHCADTGTGRLLCYTNHEWNPECTSVGDCEAGRSCVDAICR